MPAFITVDATSKHTNGTRPTRVNIDQIAYVTSAGERHDPSGNAAIHFAGGLGCPSERLVTKQTQAEVAALIAAALA